MKEMKKDLDDFLAPYEGQYFNRGLSIVLDKKHRDGWEEDFSNLTCIPCVPIALWWRGMVFAVAYNENPTYNKRGLTFLVNQGQYGISRYSYEKWFKELTKDNTFDTEEDIEAFRRWKLKNRKNTFTQDSMAANKIDDAYYAMPPEKFYSQNPQKFFKQIWTPAFQRGSFKDMRYPDSFIDW